MVELLGAHLVRKGLITQAQLDEAQKSQLIYGGSLVTNLVELGLLDPATLGQALADAYHFPLAPDEELEAVTPETLALLKPESARNHLALPLALEGRRLRVAMVNPQDPKHVEALGFATGMRIVPFLVPELRLFHLLEKYYGIPRPTRPVRPSQPKPAMGQGAPVAQRPAAPPQPSHPSFSQPPPTGAPGAAVAAARPGPTPPAPASAPGVNAGTS